MDFNRKLLQTDTIYHSHPHMSPPGNFHSLSNTTVLIILLIFTAIFIVLFFLFRYILNEAPSEIPPRRTNSSSSSTVSSSSGAKPSIVKSLPVVAYSENETKKKEGALACGVCLDKFQEGENLKPIPHCGHMFHQHCIDKWLSRHTSCPLCRTTQLLPLLSEEKMDTSTRIVEKAETSAAGERVGRTNSWCCSHNSVAVGQMIL